MRNAMHNAMHNAMQHAQQHAMQHAMQHARECTAMERIVTRYNATQCNATQCNARMQSGAPHRAAPHRAASHTCLHLSVSCVTMSQCAWVCVGVCSCARKTASAIRPHVCALYCAASRCVRACTCVGRYLTNRCPPSIGF